MPRSQTTAAIISRARKNNFIARLADEDSIINLGGNYDYMSMAYYISLDHENNGETIKPSCREMLDAYIPPLFLEKAKFARIAIPEYYISNGFIQPPVIADPINPFTLKGRIILKPARAKSIAKSLTRNFTYAICCQELPEGSRVHYFRSVLGWSAGTQYRELARIVWEVFKVPLARVRVVQQIDGSYLLSDIGPLLFEKLNARELHYIEERVSWDN